VSGDDPVSERRPPREPNQLVVALAEVAVAVVERRRETEDRRRSITVVGSSKHGGKAA
jgi:hypothetical protein